MRISVVRTERLLYTPDGRVWTTHLAAYDYWKSYLDVFEEVNIVARALPVSSVPPEARRTDGSCVSVSPIPNFCGPWQYLARARKVRRTLAEAITKDDALAFRTPSPLLTCLEPYLYETGHPYCMEVVADAYDAFAPDAHRVFLRPFFRWWLSRQVQHQCLNACACTYVTEKALQRRYPPSKSAYSTHFSDALLDDEAFIACGRPLCEHSGPIRIVHVGTFDQLYKAPDLLIDAVAACVRGGLDLALTLVGGGRYIKELKARTTAVSLGERIRFLGKLPPGEAVCAELDKADLFVLASRLEGLPRAMLEAMARGLPCIGSTVGGIPEMLPPEDLVPPADTTALASKIQQVVTDPQRMTRMSRRNLKKAKEYREDHVRQRRIRFYRYVRETTEAWLCSKGPE